MRAWAREVIARYHVERPLEQKGKKPGFPFWRITTWDFPPGPRFLRWLVRTAGYTQMRDALKPGCRCPFCGLILTFEAVT